MTGSWRGVLYPGGLPDFHRLPPSESVSSLVRWFWIPEWEIVPGHVSRQEVISFPACNLVVESDEQSVAFAGPTSRRSFRDLSGRGWAVGALLCPATVPHFSLDPSALLDSSQPMDMPELRTAVVQAMTGGGDGAARRDNAVEAFTAWLVDHVPLRDEEALLANAMADLIAGDSSVLRIDDVASGLGVSARTAQRLAQRYIGVPPAAMIRRRRLQEAAERLRCNPEVDISEVAAELGYSDHAHLTHDFRSVLGFTPSAYRLSTRDAL